VSIISMPKSSRVNMSRFLSRPHDFSLDRILATNTGNL
jgi:hypothetical protein